MDKLTERKCEDCPTIMHLRPDQLASKRLCEPCGKARARKSNSRCERRRRAERGCPVPRREINRAASKRKRNGAKAENETRLAAIKNMPPMYTSSDLLHMPPEKAARVFDAILSGAAGMVK